MARSPIQLVVEVELEDDADAEELEAAVESLLIELSEAPVDVERPADGETPPGSKGVARSAVNLLLVTGNSVALELAIDYLKDWLSRRRKSRIRLKSATGTQVVVITPDVSPAAARALIATLSGSALA